MLLGSWNSVFAQIANIKKKSSGAASCCVGRGCNHFFIAPSSTRLNCFKSAWYQYEVKCKFNASYIWIRNRVRFSCHYYNYYWFVIIIYLSTIYYTFITYGLCSSRPLLLGCIYEFGITLRQCCYNNTNHAQHMWFNSSLLIWVLRDGFSFTRRTNVADM